MEDKNSDDEVKESPSSPQMGGKKLKLNDGTPQETQDCAQQPAVASAATTSKDSKDENFDSGISVDVSESTSSDDKVASTSNNVVHMALPREGISAFFEMSRRNRKNYRKRKTPDRDSDSNASSRDSDDLTPEEMVQERVIEVSNSETESEDIESHINRFVDLCSSESEVNTSGSNNSSSSEASYESDILRMHSGDTESDDEPPWVHSTDENDDNDEDNPDKSPTPVLKPQPKHNFTILREIINRETGLTFPVGKAVKEDVMFERRFYGSLHAVYRLKKLHSLNKHRGCVNAINFHPEGHLLVSGSDDTNVVVWNWAKNIPLQTIKTGHKSNVFQSKFLYLNAESQLNIVTCARDGQVRLLQCGPAGGAASRRRLAAHSRAAHKLHVSPHEPHAVLSAGEDGLVLRHDLRAGTTDRLFVVKDRGSTIPLYSIHAHPLQPRQLVVAGRDKFIRMYDTRRAAKPVAMYCPGAFVNKNHSNNSLSTRLSLTHLTCAVYNHDGTEILGSYNDEDIYLFDPIQDAYDKDKAVTKAEESYIHRYTGHRNSATFKGVAFFGPKSEYIVSGSDCSHIYIWDKKTEAIVQWMQGDVQGVVNCVEAHPRFPILATSGLDKDVKIWLPRANEDPTFEGLERTIRNNSKAGFQSPLFNDFLPTLYDALQEQMEGRSAGLPSAQRGNIDFDGNGCTAF